MDDPAERYKTKRPNFVPLSKAALGVIEAQPKFDDCDYVFPSRAKTPFSGFSKSKAAARQGGARGHEEAGEERGEG